ncbi:MAG: GDP-L-fucose synthase [Candidatus Kuenenia stuttgartiensis]|nr:GDP-L-fucose synthase [Candidatus Kuenenia stuttgartiensis]MCL4727204.1 GDP-L-fucose synthase [Candidatus Kuenenia stuttgartiensis]MCZ7611826.1 GDP-L-fucose synthase [Ignavibacterium sp.]
MNKDSKIYVGGHTGLLGSALMKRLKSEGYTNIVTRTHRDLDLTRQEAVEAFFKNEQPEYVFLCAGLTGGIMANKTYPATFLHTNIAIQDNVFEAAQKYVVQHLVFYGSSCVYPKNSPQPIKEEYLLTGEIEGTSDAYATAKIAGIIACKSYNNQFKINRFIALIPNSMYGPNDNFDLESSHVLAALLRKLHEAKTENKESVVLWGSGNPRREFIFSEDVADSSIFAMENVDRLENRHYNVGSGTDYSIKELSGLIAAVVGFEGQIEWDTSKPDGATRKLLDISAFSNFGWKVKTPLEEGLRSVYQWFLSNHNEVKG